MYNNEGERGVAELLEDQGVPKSLAKEVAAYEGKRLFSVLYAICSLAIFLGVMLFGFLVGALLLFDNTIVSSKAAAAQAILFKDQFSLSALILLFAWILCSGIILAVLMRTLPVKLKAASFISALTWGGVDGPFARGRLRHSLKDDPNPASIQELINNWSTAYIKTISTVTLPVLLVGMGTYLLERNSWAYVTQQGYVKNPINPFKKTATTPWGEFSSVELGCNHTDDSDYIIYKINSPSGSPRLSSFKTLDNREDLDALIEVDSHIRNHANVEFTRWKWLSRNPMHPSCLRHFQSTLSKEDFSRLASLLRVGEFPDD